MKDKPLPGNCPHSRYEVVGTVATCDLCGVRWEVMGPGYFDKLTHKEIQRLRGRAMGKRWAVEQIMN